MKRAMVQVRWAFNFTAWKPTQTEWTFCNQCVQQEERERIKKFYFTKDAKAAMVHVHEEFFLTSFHVRGNRMI